MLIDRSDWIFSAQDLHDEWQKKAELFKMILADYGEKAAPLKWLLQLVEYIAASDMSYKLFPGEGMDRLHISNTIEGKINHDMALTIDLRPTDYNQVKLTLCNWQKSNRELSINWSSTCPASDLVTVFNDFIQQHPGFLTIDN